VLQLRKGRYMFNLTPKEIKELQDMLDNMAISYDDDPGDSYNTRSIDDFGYWVEDQGKPTCFHEWRRDYFFSKNIYETCKHCGQKKEEL